MDQVFVSLRDLAVGCTVPQLKYWCKLAGILLVVMNHVAYVRPEEAETLRRIAAKVIEGVSPREAVKAVARSSDHPIIQSDQPNKADPIEEMRTAMLAMAKEITTLRAEVCQLRKGQQEPQDFASWYSRFFERPPAVIETCRDRYYHQPPMIEWVECNQ